MKGRELLAFAQLCVTPSSAQLMGGNWSVAGWVDGWNVQALEKTEAEEGKLAANGEKVEGQ